MAAGTGRPETFPQLLTSIEQRYGSRSKLAAAIGMSPSRVARAMKGIAGWKFSALNCLRLAQVTGEPAGKILRAAGQGELADRIEALYGDSKQPALAPDQREILARLSQLAPAQRKALLALLQGLTPKFHKNGL